MTSIFMKVQKGILTFLHIKEAWRWRITSRGSRCVILLKKLVIYCMIGVDQSVLKV